MTADAWIPAPFRVRDLDWESGDVFTVTLDTAGNPWEGFGFRPGQFNMLYVFGMGEVPISISGDGKDGLVHTVRSVGAITRELGRLKAGDQVGVRGPFGSGWPVDKALGGDLFLVAGGIGLAPLRPVLYEVARRRRDFGRTVLLYGARRPTDLLFRREWEDWEKAGWEVNVTVDTADPQWSGNVGVVTNLIDRSGPDSLRTTAFLCGPEIMMKFCVQRLEAAGLSRDRLFVSLERNMKCAIGFCGHCQLGPKFICREGPVFPYADVRELLEVRER